MAIKILDSVLPAATVSKKGGVIVGEDLDVTNEGVLTIGGVVSEIEGKNGCYLYTDGTKLIWTPLPNTAEIDRINSDFLTNTYLAGNQGNAIINCKSGVGSYISLIRYNSTNGKFTLNGYQNKIILGYTSNTTVSANENRLDKQATLLDEAGNSQFPGTITAQIFNGVATAANYSDLAEKYLSDKEYPIGTLVCFGGKKEITIAKKYVHAIISEKPGFILNNKSEGQPIVLSGKTKIRIIGKVKKFDKIVLSGTEGIGKVKKWYDLKKPIAIALEDNLNENEKLVTCITKLTF